MNIQQLENELWEAADQLRANSRLTAAEYAMPVLGLPQGANVGEAIDQAMDVTEAEYTANGWKVIA